MEWYEYAGDWINARPWAETTGSALLLLFAAGLALFVVRRILLRLVSRLIRATRVRWDDALVDRGVLRRASWLAPLLVVYGGIPGLPNVPETIDVALQRLVTAGLVFTALLFMSALFNAVNDAYARLPLSKDRPIKGYVQIVQIFLWGPRARDRRPPRPLPRGPRESGR